MKTLYLVVIGILISGMSFSQTTVKKVTSTVAIDGQLEESFWDISTQILINFGGSDNTASFGVLWDDDYLYVGINVTDETLCLNGRQGWYDDGVEIYIDGNYNQGTTFDQYDRLFVKPVNSYWIQEAEERINGVIHKYMETYDGFSMEFAIPWNNFYINPAAGMNIGFDIAVNDDEDCNYSSNLPSQLLWSGNSNYHSNPSTWGTLNLSAQTVSYSGNYISLVSPNGSDFCINDKTTVINWVSNDITNIDIDYSTDNGSNWSSIATNLPSASGSFSWIVSATPSDQCLVKISDASNSTINDISEGQFSISSVLMPVEPLIPNIWDNYQWPYNAYFPLDPNGTNGHVGNGCGESSLARILHYWEFPITGNDELTFTDNSGHTWSANFGETIYNYDNMPNYLSPGSPEEVYTDVATLFYHAATSMHDFWGSGGDLDNMSYAMSHYFNFMESTPELKNNYTRAEWIQILLNELDNGRVLLVVGMTGAVPSGWHGGNSIAGHWYHIDGYNEDGQFHVVRGYGNEDGYFDVEDLLDFPINIGVLTGLEPELNGKELFLESHNGGEIIAAGEETEITWNSTNVSNIRIEYTENNGQDWEIITSNTLASNGSYTWTTPPLSSYECKIKLTDITDINVYDKSDDVFLIEVPYPVLHFDGTDDYAQTGGFTYPATDLTIEAWIKPNQFGSTMEILYGINPGNSSTVQFRLEEDGSILYGENPDWTYVSTPDPCIALNEWNHVAVVKENGLCKLYINGNQLADGIVNEGVNPTTIYIGGRASNMDRFYSGSIVDVRMWEIARTPSQIQGNMNTLLNGSENGLISYWRLNEGSGQTVFDLSNSGYDIQLGSTPNPDANDPEWILINWPFIIPITAGFSADVTSGNAPLTVNFIDLSTGNPNSWEWDFENDGTIDSYDQNPEWIYTEPGTYTISLKVSNGTNTVTKIKTDFISVFILPGEPSNPNPEAGATNISIYTNLSWTNGNNTETVDLYFDTVNPPGDLVLNNVAAVNFYDPDDLNTETTYYWQIICKSPGGFTEGQIWSFITETETGINNTQIVNDLFTLYPNPASSKFYVETKNLESQLIFVKILNINGKVIYSKTISTNTIIPIDMENLKKGVYFIQLRNEKYLQTKKLLLK